MKNITFYLVLFSLIFSTKHALGQLACRANINFDLGTNCVASLPVDSVGFRLDPSYNYTLSRSEFSCDDIGRTFPVTLQQRNRRTGRIVNTCWTNVTIVSNSIPSPCTRPILYCRSEITVYLNEEGYVVLRPDMISILPVTGNPYSVYDVYPNILDCGNIGNNSVRLSVISACIPSDFCTMNVVVRDTHRFRPTCHYINYDLMQFYPANLDQNIVFPGSFISFRNNVFLQYNNVTNETFEFKMLLSKDNLPDGQDLLVNQQILQFKYKTNITGKFELPKNITQGTYYLLADIFSKNAKYRYAYPTVVQRIHVGKAPKINELGSRIHVDKENEYQIFPNPFQNELNIYSLGDFDKISKLELYNVYGVLVQELDINLNVFDVSKLVPGTYLIRITEKDGHQTIHKLLKH